MGIIAREDQKRKMIELALSAARKRISPQTGFIHLLQSDPDHIRQDTIPIAENFFYVHALFRSRLMENIQEGKSLLERLIAFHVQGNFPCYLHEFPHCADLQYSSRILPPLFYLLRDYRIALGEDLYAKLERLAKDITLYLQSIQETLSSSAKARLIAFLGEFKPDMWRPETPAQWGEYCLFLQMNEKSLLPSAANWDPSLFVFTGPSKERWQEGFEPMVTLFDLFMGELFQSFSPRALSSHLVHLQASFVYPIQETIAPIKGSFFKAIASPETRQRFTLYFGDQEKTHALTLESKKGSWQIQEETLGVFLLQYAYDREHPTEDEAVECSIYLDADPKSAIFVNGEKATVFYSKDVIQAFFKNIALDICFVTEGVNAMGHISYGNRSFQKKQDPYFSYDWKLGWRTIRRSQEASLQLRIAIYRSATE
jgi:hypothetical protein